jgi:ribonuclease HI
MKVRIFTDGACSGNPGAGGWATKIFLQENSIELSGGEKETTNNRMELIAVIKGLEYIKQNAIPNKVDIYSDSAYVVNSVNNGWLKNWKENGWKTKKGTQVKNIDLWERFLQLLGKNKNIHFVKIKGHAGHTHNERVDLLARKQSEKFKLEA